MINEMKRAGSSPGLRERINAGLAKNWKFAVIILAAIILAMAGILTLDTVQNKKRDDSAKLAEDIQELFLEWLEEEPEERADDEIMALIDQALTEYPRHFAAQRALFTRGRMAYERENWLEASGDFDEFADRWPKSYLAPVSLFNAAAAKEEAENLDGAKESWSRLVDQYSDTSPHIPEALFNLGRIAESENDIETALEKYGEIASQFPHSRWTDLSRSRIIFIESRSS